MSAVPGLDAPTLVGPYKQIPGMTMPIPGQPPPPSPADLARQRKNQAIDTKRRAGTQALQTMQMMPAAAAPIAKAPAPKPLVTGQPQAATPDAYLQSQQNLIGSENKLLGLMGQQQPQYKPPNKGLEYLAAGISLLFPGAPIAHAAGGLLQGMQAGADQRYQREQQAQQQEIGNAEKQTQVFGTIADAQARVQASLEATRARQQEYAQRHSDAMTALQEKHQEFVQTFPLKSALTQSLIRYRVGELANQVSRNTITQRDADKRLAMSLNIAKLLEAGRGTRFAGDTSVKLAIAQTQAIDRQLDGQLRTLDAGVATDTTGQKAIEAQQTAAALIDQANTQVQTLIDQVSSGRPGLADPHATAKVIRTGKDAKGRKVVQLQDGTTHYDSPTGPIVP